MRTPYVLLKCLARALAPYADRLADWSLVEILPAVAEGTWPAWARGTDEEKRRARLEVLARAPDVIVARHAERLTDHEGLARYLRLMPAAIRQVFRRPGDPSGTSVPSWLHQRKAGDLLPFLPLRLPHLPDAEAPWPRESLGVNHLGDLWLGGSAVFRYIHDPRLRKTLTRPGQGRNGIYQRDYIRGGNLAGWIREVHHGGGATSPWFVQHTLAMVADLAAVVGEVHRRNETHGNLKPTNVVVRSGAKGFQLVLVDQELGRWSVRAALAGRTRGRPLAALAVRGGDAALYASANTWANEETGPGDDVHALGVMGSQMLLGDLTAGVPADWSRWTNALSHLRVSPAVIDLLASCMGTGDGPADAAIFAGRLTSQVNSPRLTVGVAPSVNPEAPTQRRKVVVCAGGRGECQSINEALTKFGKGTHVVVRPGVYRESVVLAADVEIVGDGPPGSVVIESENGDCVVSRAAKALLRNLTFRCVAGRKEKKFYAVEVTAGRLVIEDCDLTSDSLACLAVHGSRARPEVRRCKIHDSRMGGIYFYNLAGGVIEDCDIYGNRYPGVEITGGANPTLRRCRIHHQTEHNGVMVYTNGKGLFEDCDIFANKFSDLRIHDGGNPILRRCRLHEGTSCGVMITNGGRGMLEECELFGHANAAIEVSSAGTEPTIKRCKIVGTNMAGLFFYDGAGGLVEDCEVSASPTAVVEIKTAADPKLRRCKIRSGKSTGVLAWENGKGRLEDCQVFGHGGVGVSIRTGGDPVLLRCRIRDGLKGGVSVTEGGKGTLEDCDLPGNALANLEVSHQGEPTLRRCRIRDGKQGGILIHDEGRCLLEQCEVSGNRVAGIEVGPGGSPELRWCQIRDGEREGVVIRAKGQATLEDCTLSGNQAAAVEVQSGGNLVLRRCRIDRGKQPGIWVHERGQGTVELCELTGEAGEAWRIDAGGQVHRQGNKELPH